MKNYFIISIIILSVVFCQRPERNEIITERHPNGLKKLVLVFEGTGINETLVGKYGFYENGLKEFSESYNNNQKNGKSIFWDEDGTKIVEGRYKMGMMDGFWTYYYKNGKKKGEGSFNNGDGTNLDENDIPMNGKVGLWKTWYENGQKRFEVTFLNEKVNGFVNVWYENGQKNLEGKLKNDIEDGLWKIWYENGQKTEEGTYKDGV